MKLDVTTKLGVVKVPGFRVSAVTCGLKKSGKRDLGLIVADVDCVAAGVFTSNKICAAPVKHSRASLKKSKGHARAILINAGNANCCTGQRGRDAAAACAARVAEHVGCAAHEVLLCSTGIIGEQLPLEKMTAGIDAAVPLLNSRKKDDKQFADAIRTLDTYAKECGTTVMIGGKKITIAGAAKGIGMCAPNMATVLIALVSDVAIEQKTLQGLLKKTVDATFNKVSVDSDTSTNDSCLMLANGVAGNAVIKGMASADARLFAEALHGVCYRLARMLAADGEGAEKFMQVLVHGAKHQKDADLVARAICESPLIKTAVCGADPNWGRIMMAAGKCGAMVVEEKTTVRISGHTLFEKGEPTSCDHGKVSAAMKKKDVVVEIDLGMGKAEAEMLGCDLTHGYITINADYHT